MTRKQLEFLLCVSMVSFVSAAMSRAGNLKLENQVLTIRGQRHLGDLVCFHRSHTGKVLNHS